MSNTFRYHPFVAVFEVFGEKTQIVDNVFSSEEREIHSTTPFVGNCVEYEFQKDGNYSVDLRQAYMASKLKFVKVVVKRITEPEKQKESSKKWLKRMWKQRCRRNKRFQILLLLM